MPAIPRVVRVVHGFQDGIIFAISFVALLAWMLFVFGVWQGYGVDALGWGMAGIVWWWARLEARLRAGKMMVELLRRKGWLRTEKGGA